MAARKKAQVKRKKAPAKKAPAKKAPAKRGPAKKAPAARKAPARRKAAKKKAPARRAAPKRAAAGKKRPAAKRPAAPAMRAPAPEPKPRAASAPPVKVLGPLPPASALPAARTAAGPIEERVGVVTHYFSHLSVASIWLESGSLGIGDTVHISGHTSDFRQRVESLQVEHEAVEEVRAGQEFGLKVVEHAREHDVVYKVGEPAG